MQSFFQSAMDFGTVSMVTSFRLYLQTEVVGLRTPNPAGYPKCSNLKK